MSTNITKILSLLVLALTLQLSKAQGQSVADFENFTLPSTDTFWNGSSTPLGTTFASGSAIFPNYYDTSWGGYWRGGWAYSNMQDSMTGNSTNLYGARPAIGYNGSANYAVGQQNSWVRLDTPSRGKIVNGFYVTNSTYAARVMETGNTFSRKFGDTTGTGHSGPQGSYPDYFLLTVYGWYNGSKITDSVNFYLADFRGPDSLDYIVGDWQWVNLSSLGNVDSLQFTMRSSDEGAAGINTPLFFCIDNFTTADIALATTDILSRKPLKLFPNPVQNEIRVSLQEIGAKELDLEIFDAAGRTVVKRTVANMQDEYIIDFANQTAGMYFVTLKDQNTVWSTKVIKR